MGNLSSLDLFRGLTDLVGPKMYNALASSPTTGSKGTTRLHMDMADALNIMTFASPAPDGGPGSAAWDLFRSEDSGKICEFLRQKFQGMVKHDPIHSQQFFLDETLRQQLLDEYGVKSHRIYQRPGEAVFIPAGCAHQVSAQSDQSGSRSFRTDGPSAGGESGGLRQSGG